MMPNPTPAPGSGSFQCSLGSRGCRRLAVPPQPASWHGDAVDTCLKRYSGTTLVELITSLAIMTVLLGAMGSAIFLSTKAFPSADDTTTNAVTAARVADQIIGELEVAKSFTVLTATKVEFTVADRDTPANGDETIKYEWSGTPGEPLTRKYNNGTAVNVLDSVEEFALDYNVESINQTPPGIEGPEQVFIQQDASNIGDWGTYNINDNFSAAQYFLPTLPVDATSWKITRAQFYGQQHGAATRTLQVSVRPAATGGEPSTTVLDEVQFPETALTANTWHEAAFTNAGGLDPSAGHFIVFRQVETGGGNTFMLNLGDTGPAYANTTFYEDEWSENTGLDIWLQVWGTVSTIDPNWVPPGLLRSVRVTLNTTQEGASRIETAAAILNTPEITP